MKVKSASVKWKPGQNSWGIHSFPVKFSEPVNVEFGWRHICRVIVIPPRFTIKFWPVSLNTVMIFSAMKCHCGDIKATRNQPTTFLSLSLRGWARDWKMGICVPQCIWARERGPGLVRPGETLSHFMMGQVCKASLNRDLLPWTDQHDW